MFPKNKWMTQVTHRLGEQRSIYVGPCVTLSTWGPSKSNPTKWSSCLAQWDTHKLVLKRWYTTNEQTLFPKKNPFKQGIYVTHFPALGDLVKSRTHFVFFADLFAFAFAFALPRGLSIFSPWFLGVEPFFGKSVALTHGEKNYKIHYENVCPQ